MSKQIDWTKFGHLVKEKRSEKKLTQAEVAKEIGASQPVISLIERGNPVGLNEEREEALLSVLGLTGDEIPQEEQQLHDPKRTSVFVSYSHKDRTFLDRLSVHLKPLEKKGVIDFWVDTKIVFGEQWKAEIERALGKSHAAILLISADFLASNFIIDNELPPLLEKAERDGTKIIPIILKPCRFARDQTLSRFQAVNAPDNPLSGMTEHETELVYDAVAQHLERLQPV